MKLVVPQPLFRLSKSKYLERKIRRYDDPPDAAMPSWTLLREAILAGRTAEALELLEDGMVGAKSRNDRGVLMGARLLTYIADTFGEEHVADCWRRQSESFVRKWVGAGYSIEEQVQMDAEQQRQLGGVFAVAEEQDRYVITCDPCGSGGKTRRDKVGGVTKKSYPWSWGKTGIPYYCVHCALDWEITPIEIRGYPIRVNLIGDAPEDPCVHLFYKKPELIPQEYFTRIGKIKATGQGRASRAVLPHRRTYDGSSRLA
jgi:hypothetical protein